MVTDTLQWHYDMLLMWAKHKAHMYALRENPLNAYLSRGYAHVEIMRADDALKYHREEIAYAAKHGAASLAEWRES